MTKLKALLATLPFPARFLLLLTALVPVSMVAAAIKHGVQLTDVAIDWAFFAVINAIVGGIYILAKAFFWLDERLYRARLGRDPELKKAAFRRYVDRS